MKRKISKQNEAAIQDSNDTFVIYINDTDMRLDNKQQHNEENKLNDRLRYLVVTYFNIRTEIEWKNL